jgi:hypothetical protein
MMNTPLEIETSRGAKGVPFVIPNQTRKPFLSFFKKIEKKIFYKNPTSSHCFMLATKDVQEEVRKSFMTQKKAGTFETNIKARQIKRVTSNCLEDLAVMSDLEVSKLSDEGLHHIGELGVVTSGAGLWSRGGGSVKALVPYNISAILDSEFSDLSEAGKIVGAKNSEEILKFLNVDTKKLSQEIIEKTARSYKNVAIATIKNLTNKTIFHYQALNPIDMKFVNVALVYVRTGKYISLDIWTSEQTHALISDYLDWLKKHLHKKIFHSNKVCNSNIIKSLDKYFKKSIEMKETHLFGYQEGLHAIDASTGLFRPDLPSIGKGAGAIIEYLEKSGRMKRLRARGTRTLVFENIEVVSDYAPLFASHLKSTKPVSVVLVPQKEGYVGGSPFLIEKDNGDWNIELLEQSVLSDDLKYGNHYFNTNTIFFSTDVKPPETLSFEMKEQNSIARVKQNMGDVTFDNYTHGIGGRLGRDQKMVEYENFKNFDEYGDNGNFYIRIFQRKWEEMIGRG